MDHGALSIKMGHEMAEEFSGFYMQNFSLYNTASRVVLRGKEADHTLFSTPYLHDCMPWGGGCPLQCSSHS